MTPYTNFYRQSRESEHATGISRRGAWEQDYNGPPFHYKPTTKEINVGGALGNVAACACQLQKSNWWMGKNWICWTSILKILLGQQVALCTDKTTGNCKLNSWNLKWILILKISENEYSHQWCQFQFSIFTKIEWPQYTLTPITSIFEIWVVWTVILNWHYHGNINNGC